MAQAYEVARRFDLSLGYGSVQVTWMCFHAVCLLCTGFWVWALTMQKTNPNPTPTSQHMRMCVMVTFKILGEMNSCGPNNWREAPHWPWRDWGKGPSPCHLICSRTSEIGPQGQSGTEDWPEHLGGSESTKHVTFSFYTQLTVSQSALLTHMKSTFTVRGPCAPLSHHTTRVSSN